MRKIIQISESFVDGHSVGDYFNISALCDDGSLWYLNDFKKGWQRYPDIPQDDVIPALKPSHTHTEGIK
ncbi:hypothetical protein [Mannheimia haemolytica]|uniref:hypothetical protein n=1 Tax=Mannheimia haemolytica TaxID=75985 RepID=UPI001CF21AB4|nr:hypothetical protein [Mannheimia haemolytica]MCB4227899.1 hypothetical protein [Mannheimia haemolytica]